MKASDFIFEYRVREKSYLCRVRTFVTSDGGPYVVLTNIEGIHLGGSITNWTEDIHDQLKEHGYITDEYRSIEHYEGGMWNGATFDLIEFDDNGAPKWEKISEEKVLRTLKCSEREFSVKTCESPRLFHQVERMTYQISPFLGIERFECPEKARRRLEIDDAKKPKSELLELIGAGAGERELHEYLISDLTYFSDMYANPDDEYICFSEFPVGDGFVDFALFTGRSRMDVVLIEIKGASFDAITSGSYRNFSSKFNECAQQARRRTGYIVRNYESFRLHAHSVRERVEKGSYRRKHLVGPEDKLEVDPDKDVKPYVVCIAGVGENDLEESRLRHEFETDGKLPIRLETWNSWMAKQRRNA